MGIIIVVTSHRKKNINTVYTEDNSETESFSKVILSH